MLNDNLADASLIQPLLAATVVSMVISPMLIRHNAPIADLLTRSKVSIPTALQRELAATRQSAKRDHVVVCGFGRVARTWRAYWKPRDSNTSRSTWTRARCRPRARPAIR